MRSYNAEQFIKDYCKDCKECENPEEFAMTCMYVNEDMIRK